MDILSAKVASMLPKQDCILGSDFTPSYDDSLFAPLLISAELLN
jgi:hypothetical protein